MPKLIILSIVVLASCGTPPSIIVEPLQVVSWQPNRGAACVAVDTEDFVARLTFSDDIQSATLTPQTFFIRPERGASVAANIEYTKATQSAEIILQESLEYDTLYELVASETIEGVEQGHLAAELISTFTTLSPGGCFQ